MEHRALQRRSAQPPAKPSAAVAVAGPGHRQLMQLSARLNTRVAEQSLRIAAPAQRKLNPPARSTARLAGVALNNDAGLEREADVMGARAAQLRAVPAGPSPAQRATASAAPLQAVWEEAAEGTLKWDKPINGIQWFYRLEDGKYSYQAVSAIAAKYEAGQGQWHPYEAWQEAGASHVGAIEGRVAAYEAAVGKGRSTPRKETIGKEIFVDDDLPKRFNFQHEGQTANSHFHNTYFAEGGGTAVLRENYLSNVGKSFFASDAFFSQFAAAAILNTGKPSAGGLADVPTEPPQTIVRDTIDNQVTKQVLQDATGISADADAGDKSEHVFHVGDPAFARILGTPNGKATLNIIDDFNFINRARGQAAYTIDRITVLHAAGSGNNGWKIRLRTAKE